MEVATRPSEFPFSWEEFWGFFDQDENGLPIIKEIDKDASANELPPDLVKEIQEARQRIGAIKRERP